MLPEDTKKHKQVNKQPSVTEHFGPKDHNAKPIPYSDKALEIASLEWVIQTNQVFCYVFGLLLHLPYADYHWDCLISLSWSLPKALTVIFVLLHCDSCTIWSCSNISVWYDLLWVQLSLVDAHRPLLSFTYTSIYDEEYINCTIRTLGP